MLHLQTIFENHSRFVVFQEELEDIELFFNERKNNEKQ